MKNLRDISGRVVVQLPLAISFSRLQRAKNGGKDNIFSRSRVIADISAHGFVFGEKPSTFLWLKSDWIVSTFNISAENSEIRTRVGSQPHCYSPYQVKRHYMWKHYRGPTEKTKQFPSSTENRGHHLWKQQRRLFQRGRGCRPEKARLHQPWERFIIGSHKCRREKTVFNHFGRPIWWFHEKIHHQPRSWRWWWRQSIPELQKVGPNQNFVQIWSILGRAATGDR